MRVLSADEVKDLVGSEQIPIELRSSYFPVALRAYRDGFSVAQIQHRPVNLETANEILEDTRVCLDVIALNDKDRPYPMWRDLSDFSLHEYEFGENRKNREMVAAYGLMHVSRLVSNEQLRSLGIEPVPGYIYLALTCFYNTRRNLSRDGSRYLGEQSYYDIVHHSMMMAGPGSSSPTGSEVVKKKDHNWRGLIADIEQVTNSRQVYASAEHHLDNGAIRREYIIASPIEFPPGYVTDTALRLQSKRDQAPTVVKRFSQMVFGQTQINSPHLRAAEASLPKREVEVRGPEDNWRHSEDPWFIQTILMARLIGGSFWRYTIQRLEQGGHQT